MTRVVIISAAITLAGVAFILWMTTSDWMMNMVIERISQ